MAGRTRGTVILVLVLVALTSAVAGLAALQSEAPQGVAVARIRIDGPDGATLYDRTLAGTATAYGLLAAAAARDGFTLGVQEFPMGTMVVQIFEHRNAGACGWVYEVDGKSGDRAATHFGVGDGSLVHWFWACHG